MPVCFKESFGCRITVILDCFEVFIESPSNLCSSAECWSNYKHHKTAKNLIAISPQGSVVYISDAYGGRASDKYITEDSELFNFIIPGDVLMTDRGFTVEETASLLGATVILPAFTRGNHSHIFFKIITIVRMYMKAIFLCR